MTENKRLLTPRGVQTMSRILTDEEMQIIKDSDYPTYKGWSPKNSLLVVIAEAQDIKTARLVREETLKELITEMQHNCERHDGYIVVSISDELVAKLGQGVMPLWLRQDKDNSLLTKDTEEKK